MDMERLVINNDTEKKYIFSEIIKMQKQGIISKTDTIKAFRYVSTLTNEFNNPTIEQASFKYDTNSINSKDLDKIILSAIVRS
ncbi:hypothetical protein EZS27_021488 [termite gut metagenome]|jgi:hypothetical protein|uniref:Uncharacterized protein n=1 Tax=termite gut metagenome TaxID=433724 RepID=A0A5J4R7S8_9ZZZZ